MSNEKWPYKTKDLQKLADCYFSLNLAGQNHLLTVVKSLATYLDLKKKIMGELMKGTNKLFITNLNYILKSKTINQVELSKW